MTPQNNTASFAGALWQSAGRDALLVLGMLEELRHGLLEVRLPDGSERLYGHGQPMAAWVVRDERVFTAILQSGDIGFAEAYIDGWWESPDLPALMGLLAHNRDALRRAVYGHWWGVLKARCRHWMNANTRSGSRRNIMAHYDLGNEFYRTWLDAGMTYSSALFADGATSLAAAQDAKYERILARLDARPGQEVLEIGCGWGGFAERAVHAGLKLSGVTLSPAQLAWAQKRVPEADLRLMDYRDIRQSYDHVVSIEMFEAVGERYWPDYFRTLACALKPGGKAVVQSIVIDDALFASYRRGTDFIQQHVFPGGMLPSPKVFGEAAAKAGLKVSDQFAFGKDYGRTLALWHERFEAAWPEIRAQGFDERFRRLWRMYLAYCEGGFAAGSIDVVQFELQHAG